MDQKKLITDLKAGQIAPLYLLYGDERYLIQHYGNAITNAVFPSKKENQFEEKQFTDTFDQQTPVSEIIMTAETLPFFAPHRLIHVKDSKLFVTGRKVESEAMAKYLPNIPPGTTIIFTEYEIDKRSKLYKEAAKTACVIDCSTPTPQTLATWATKLARQNKKEIAPPTAHKLVQTVGTNMALLSQEINKLIAYVGANPQITPADVEAICTPTTESRIFDLIKAMMAKNTSQALTRYHDMLLLKESPIMVLTMVIRQFRNILLCKLAKEAGLTIYESTKELSLRDFMVEEALRQGSKFTVDQLIGALDESLETDIKIKSGLITPELGVELLIIKFS